MMTEGLKEQLAAVVGVWSERRFGPHEIDRTLIRRFYQAVGDINPVYWDEESAGRSRYGSVVAPPLFPSSSGATHHGGFEMPDGALDPLEGKASDDHFSGIARHAGDVDLLPRLPLPARRGGMILGFEHEIYKLARLGDRLSLRQRYAEVSEIQTADGPKIRVVIETEYRNQDDEVLLVSRNTTLLTPAEGGEAR